MKKATAIMMGLVIAAAAITAGIAQAADKPAPAPIKKGPAPAAPANKDCQMSGQGQCPQGTGECMGQQKRFGWGKGQGQGQGMGQGMGQGKGFRGGPRDGTGPRRDGTGGQCPMIQK